MKMTVRRYEYGDHYTVSKMYINDSETFECYVLEDKVREPGVKVQNETAIPAGTYTVIMDYSNHFLKTLPHILDVPMFEGVRIHSGNTVDDTEGCLLVGKVWGGGDTIMQSRDAFNALLPKINEAWDKKETITITILDTK